MARWNFGARRRPSPSEVRFARTLLVAVVSACLFMDASAGQEPVRARGKTWYVSPKGRDTNPGTERSPFRTIQKGVDVARAGETILLRGGVYRESVRMGRSGAQGRPIELRNYLDEHPVIEATPTITKDQGLKGILIQNEKGHTLPISWLVIEGLEIRHGWDGIKFHNGSDIYIRRSFIHDATSQGIIGNGHRIHVDGNVIARNGLQNGNPRSNKNHGIYMTGTLVVITNNLFYRNQAYGIQVAGYTREDIKNYAGDEFAGASDWVIRNNTFVSHKVRSPIVLWKPATKRIRIEENIFYDCYRPDVIDYTPKENGHVIRENFSGDPQFVDPKGMDFRLKPGSPAAGKGTQVVPRWVVSPEKT